MPDSIEFQIGSTSRYLDNNQRFERAKKAIHIAARSSYHRNRILGQENVSDLDDIVKKCDEKKSYSELAEFLGKTEDVYQKLKAEAAEIASSNDCLFHIGRVTSFISQPFACIPSIHNAIRSFFKKSFENEMGHEKFKEKPISEGSIFYEEITPSQPTEGKDASASNSTKASSLLEKDLNPIRSDDIITLDDSTASLYEQLHEGIRRAIQNGIVDSIIAPDPANDTYNPDTIINNIHKQYGKVFKKYAQKGDKNLLSRYVAALDKTNESRPYDSIYIHYMALKESYQKQPTDPKKEALKYLASAVSVNQAFMKAEDELRKDYIEDFNKFPVNNALTDQRAGNLCTFIENKLESSPETRNTIAVTYKSIIDNFGYAPFLLRTGKKDSREYSHYASAIIEKNQENGQYSIRFEDPSSTTSDIYQIKDGKLYDVLWELHNVYMNGSPHNNIGHSNIDRTIIGSDNVEKTLPPEPRKLQKDEQCGIHSSRRIIPASIYSKAGLEDCDILSMCES